VYRLAALLGWSERIRTHAFPIEPRLWVGLVEFGNIGRRCPNVAAAERASLVLASIFGLTGLTRKPMDVVLGIVERKIFMRFANNPIPK
jgi:hypothetical protein